MVWYYHLPCSMICGPMRASINECHRCCFGSAVDWVQLSKAYPEEQCTERCFFILAQVRAKLCGCMQVLVGSQSAKIKSLACLPLAGLNETVICKGLLAYLHDEFRCVQSTVIDLNPRMHWYNTLTAILLKAHFISLTKQEEQHNCVRWRYAQHDTPQNEIACTSPTLVGIHTQLHV